RYGQACSHHWPECRRASRDKVARSVRSRRISRRQPLRQRAWDSSLRRNRPAPSLQRNCTMHSPNQYDLLRQRRFAPFFWTQFQGAGNDNIYKNALVIFVAFHAATLTSLHTNTLVNLAGAVFIAPFVLLSATAGQLADKLEKSRLIRWIKLFEIGIMAVGFAGFWRRDITLLFSALALLGLHSTLFGPVKYAILPQTLESEELIGGNGLVEMGTFVAILIGTIVGGLVVAIEGSGPVLAGAVA